MVRSAARTSTTCFTR